MSNLEVSKKEITLALLQGGFTATDEEIKDILKCDEMDASPANHIRATARVLARKVNFLHSELTENNLF